MKTKHYLYLIAVFTLICALPVAVNAEETVTGSVDTSAQTSTAPNAPVPANVREKLRLEYELKMKNMKANQGIRNDALEQRKIASSTSPKPLINALRKDIKVMNASTSDARKDLRMEERADIKDIRGDARVDIRNASSSVVRREIRKDMWMEMFITHRDMLVRQLNLALSNLQQIKGRIVSHLGKAEQSGRSMTEPRALLVTFDAKVITAQTAITALSSFTPTVTSTTTVSGERSVNLDRPRQIGEVAIKAVKEAREALNAVVRSIMKNMGKGNGSATSTISATSTTSTP